MTTMSTRRSTSSTAQGIDVATTRDLVLRALASPAGQSAEVARAIEVLTAAAQGSATMIAPAGPQTQSVDSRFHTIVDLLNGAIDDLDSGDDLSYLIEDDVAYFVPEGWAEFLQAPAIEDADLDMPWLDELGD